MSPPKLLVKSLTDLEWRREPRPGPPRKTSRNKKLRWFMGQPKILHKDGYNVMVREEVTPGTDEFTLWDGLPHHGQLLGRWVVPSETPENLATEVEQLRMEHMRKKHGA
jgi:hypothetical protein